MKLDQNTILVTGGSRGIGLEIARQFTRAGSKVIITGRNAEGLSTAAAEIRGLLTIQSDAADPTQIKSLADHVFAEYPETNIVVNNAGIMRTVNLQKADLPPETLTGEIDINLKGPIRMIDAFLPHLKKTPNAAIVNVSSGLAFVPMPISAVYCATKAAMHSYTQSLRVQLSNTGVKVFELMPPATETNLTGNLDEAELKGMSLMKADKMVASFIEGFARDQFEIRPGQSNQLRLMSRFLPNFILKQMSRSVADMHQSAAK